MYYKVESGILVEAPKKSLKVFIANPTDEQYRFFGYTDEIVEDDKPEITEKQYLEEHYEQKNGVIYKHYNVVDIPEEDIPEEDIPEEDIPEEDLE